MILEAILNLFFQIPIFLISLLPQIDFSLPAGLLNPLLSVLGVLSTLLPLAQILPILIFNGVLDAVHIVSSIIWRVKSFIPTMGK